MSHFSIAALQLDLSAEDNLSFIADEITKTKRRFPWVNMIVLSELCSHGTEKKYAEQLPGKVEQFYQSLATSLDLWIVTGSQYEKIGNEIYNSCAVINNLGEVVNRYRKIYPFYPYESGVCSGKEFVVFDVPQGRIGVAICYDLWFPEVARTLACMGAEVILYPTLTGSIDRPQELILAQATSITNQCYTFSVNASGENGIGQSIVVGPDGDVIYKAGQKQETIPIEVDFERVRRCRNRGLHGLGQPLKSFRDNPVQFPIYNDQNAKNESFKNLNDLVIPKKEQ